MNKAEKAKELEKLVESLEASTKVYLERAVSSASERERREMEEHLQAAWKHAISAKKNLMEARWFDDVAFHYDCMMARVERDLYMRDFHKLAKRESRGRAA